jgi:transposase
MPQTENKNSKKGRRISPSNRDTAIQLFIQGQSARRVADSLGIGIATALKIRKENEENIPPPKMGRPNKIFLKTRGVLARQIKTGRLTSLRDAQQFIQERDDMHVHVEKVRRNLRQYKIRAYVKPKKPDLKRNHMQERLAFARRHIKWMVNDWKRVMFSDESIISRMGSFGRNYFYSDREHKRLLPHQVHPIPQAGGGKMMVWGCITFFGPGDLCRINGTLDSEFYREILNDYVLASFKWYGMDPATSIFQQDNARVHTASLIQNWFRKHNVTVLQWPSNSPDLNPIEHVWAYIKRRLFRYKQPAKDINQLWKRVEKIWRKLPSKLFRNLYESMPRRMRALLQSRGGPIKY